MTLFNLFWINGSWQKRLTAEDAEDRRGLLIFSASLCVLSGFLDRPENNKKSREHTGKVYAPKPFIPTCVGNSAPNRNVTPYLSVHPHVCGELSCENANGSKDNGSSPRVWGTLFAGRGAGVPLRFIPTWVGNSIYYSTSKSRFPVHPHVGGELGRMYTQKLLNIGSSPRGWGTH